MEKNETILDIIKNKGPVLPVQVAKEINSSILIASARLSELLTAKQIKISSIKVGGSPLYYLPGQEEKLQNFVNNLSGMEKKAYDIIRQKKVIKDLEQEPAVRVALRLIKDFAIPLQVGYDDKKEIFWRWYLTDNKETEFIIKGILSKKIEQLPLKQKKVEESQTKIPEIKKRAFFSKEVYEFFDENKLSVIEDFPFKKILEKDFIVELQTAIGNIKYFCKYKGKKKINDADLSSALIQAQSKNLPLLFLSNGSLSKKAQEMLSNELKNTIFKKMTYSQNDILPK